MSYKPNQILRFRSKEQIDIICDFCNNQFNLTYKSAEKNRKKNGDHKCHKCAGIPLKPQQRMDFWTEEKRKSQGNSLKNSKKYKKAIKKRNVSGKNNGMFGRKTDIHTKLKMSKSRVLRTGDKSPNWQGGKTSLNSRIRKVIHKVHNWYFRVYQKDNFKCVLCDSKKKLDAHHIDPLNQIIKRLCQDRTFSTSEEKFNWLIEQEEIIDKDLKNGQTLCRECHKKTHNKNWGSHDCR